jgi:hypothetical protein
MLSFFFTFYTSPVNFFLSVIRAIVKKVIFLLEKIEITFWSLGAKIMFLLFFVFHRENPSEKIILFAIFCS